MTQRITRACFLCLLLAAPLYAQQAGDIEQLVSRSDGGDKQATRALAEAYYVGRGGVAQDYVQAAHWYRRLATQGDAAAQTSLGLMYARGLGFPRDMGEARKWWSLAAAQNDSGAQHNLGMVYLQGSGVRADPPQALHWFQRAAARGHVLAQRMTGLMHFEGNGTPRDQQTGLMWLKIAADNGEEGAQESLRIIAGRVSADTMTEAEKRAAVWKLKQQAIDKANARGGS